MRKFIVTLEVELLDDYSEPACWNWAGLLDLYTEESVVVVACDEVKD